MNKGLRVFIMERKRAVYPLACIIICALLFFGKAAQAAPFDSWQWVNPLPQGNDLYGVAYGSNNTFVAVGYGGTVITSADGAAWSKQASGTEASFFSVAYGNGVVVAGSGTGVFLSADGGGSWAKVYNSPSPVVAVTYSADQAAFVATIYDSDNQTGGILRSLDNGSTWTRTYTAGYGLLGVCYGKNIFVAVGDSGQVLTSPNGADWTLHDSVTFDELHGIIFEQGIFVAVGYSWDDSRGLIMTSPDGASWSRYMTNSNETVYGIAFGNNTFAAVSDYGSIAVAPSTGAPWTILNNALQQYPLYGITFANNLFVATGAQGAIVTSSNGASWTELAAHGAWPSLSLHPERRWSVVEGDDLLIATNNLDTMLRSPNGVAWTSSALPVWNSSDMIFANDLFVRVGADGKVFSSVDGTQWTLTATLTDQAGTPFALDGITYGKDMFAVTAHLQTSGDTYGAVFTSENLTVWTKRWSSQPSGNGILPGRIAFGNGFFAALLTRSAQGENSLTSTDGITWTPMGEGGLGLAGIAFGSNTFAAYTRSGQILTSPDGGFWTVAFTSSQFDFQFSDIKFSKDTFLALGNYEDDFADKDVNNGKVVSSPDGITWTETRVASSRRLDAVEYGPDGFVALGEAGTIVRSADPESSRLGLKPGWNFVSFSKLPSQLPSATIETVLGHVLSKVLIVWGHDNQAGTWKKYRPENPGNNNSLALMEAGKGYWIYMGEEDEIDMTLWIRQLAEAHLYEGWNLVGYGGQDGKSASLSLNSAGISGNWSIIWNWSDGAWTAKQARAGALSVPALSNLYRDRAYWIHAIKTADWVQ
jgi:hypothetical protein